MTAIDRDIAERRCPHGIRWPWQCDACDRENPMLKEDVLYGLSPIALRQRKTCRQCGKGALYWKRVSGEWKLHHWAMLDGDREPRFVLHRCGFTSDGKPTTPETD